MAINASGGTAPRGETVVVTYPSGGLTGAAYVTIIHPTLGNVACTGVTVNSDTELEFTSPSSGLTHGVDCIIAIA